MTKQEEIREGIEGEILEDREGIIDRNEAISCTARAKRIMEYLHSQGVVIKVKKKRPLVDGTFEDFSRCSHPFNFHEGYYKAQQDMAGYVAVEPLVKEATNGI